MKRIKMDNILITGRTVQKNGTGDLGLVKRKIQNPIATYLLTIIHTGGK